MKLSERGRNTSREKRKFWQRTCGRAFDYLLREIDQRETETAKFFDEQERVRKGKEIEVKGLSEQVGIVESMLRQLATKMENSITTIDH